MSCRHHPHLPPQLPLVFEHTTMPVARIKLAKTMVGPALTILPGLHNWKGSHTTASATLRTSQGDQKVESFFSLHWFPVGEQGCAFLSLGASLHGIEGQ